MTIRLLCAYDRYPANAIVTLDAGTEAGLIAAKQALADTTGGTPFVPASGPVQSRTGSFTVRTGRAETVLLTEGQALIVSGTVSTAGSVSRLDATGAVVGTPWTVPVGTLGQIGPYAGGQKLLITCTSGSIDAVVQNAVLGVAAAVDTSLRMLNVSTRCSLPLNKSGSNTHNSRSTHFIRTRVDNPCVVFPNWYSVNGIETSVGTTEITGSIEYPPGTITQLKFNGLVTGSVGFDDIVSDPLPFTLPANAEVRVGCWRKNAGGLPYTGYAQANPPVMPGDQFESGNNLADKTMGGTIAASSGTGNIFFPAAIVGMSTVRSPAGMGDSTAYGSTDNADPSGNMGCLARSIAPVAPYMNLAYPSNQVTTLIAGGNAKAFSLANRFATDVTLLIGTNDIDGGISAGTVFSRILTGFNFLTAGQRRYSATLFPRTTSTDSWATTANQTPVPTKETERVLLNTLLRAIPAGCTDTFDIASAVETSFNSGIFKVETGDASPAVTSEGVHLIGKGYRMVARSGVIPKALFAARI